MVSGRSAAKPKPKATIAGMPGGKSDVGRRLDALSPVSHRDAIKENER